MANDIYAPQAYGQEYNKKLLEQILRPIREREQAGTQAIREQFAAGGGYGSGSALSALRKLREDIGQQVTSASTDVGLASALAKQKEAMTRAGWQFQAGESEKDRLVRESLTKLGYSAQAAEGAKERQLQQNLAGLRSGLTREGWEFQATEAEKARQMQRQLEEARLGLTREGWQFQAGESEKEREFREDLTRAQQQFQAEQSFENRELQKYMQQKGFSQAQIMAEIQYQNQKRLARITSQLQDKYRDSPWADALSSALGGLTSAATTYGLGQL